MSTKIIFAVVVIALVVAGAWYVKGKPETTTPSQSTEQASTQQTSSANDTSDQGLDQDMSSLDAKIDVVGQSSASVDQGVNDKPVQQTE